MKCLPYVQNDLYLVKKIFPKLNLQEIKTEHHTKKFVFVTSQKILHILLKMYSKTYKRHVGKVAA